MIVHIVLVLTLVVSGILCHYLAKYKKRSPVFWGTMGAVFGPFAVIYLITLKSNSKSEDKQ
jgi:hypothetical protein